MATIPSMATLSNSSVDVLNAIRNYATQNYKDYVPIATPDAERIREIGNVMMDFPELQNEFINTLVARIGKVLVTSRLFQNPWAFMKKGILEYGETIEEVFVNIAKPNQFDPETGETEVFKRVIPDVKTAFHVMNFQKFYKVTISREQLRTAFLSIDGVTNLIEFIVNSLYSGAANDEFLIIRYMLAKEILNNKMGYAEIAGVDTKANVDSTVATIKQYSNDFTFMSTKYNIAGASTFCNKENQYVIMTTDFDANVDVKSLATAFNIDYVQFMGRRVLAPKFGDLDFDRLELLFGDQVQENFTRFTDEEVEALNTIGCILMDENYVMVLDNMLQFTDIYNPQNLSWNNFLHTWKTFSISPFANCVAFTTGTLSARSDYEIVITDVNGNSYGSDGNPPIDDSITPTLDTLITVTAVDQDNESLPEVQNIVLTVTSDPTNSITIVNNNNFKVDSSTFDSTQASNYVITLTLIMADDSIVNAGTITFK